MVNIFLMNVVIEWRPETAMDRSDLVSDNQFLIGTEEPVCPRLYGARKPHVRGQLEVISAG